MPLEPAKRFPVMCLTQDGLAVDRVEQASRLCAAGARWIQLRMKNAGHETWLAAARDVVSVCRRHGAVCVINDSVDIALEAGADGVHLGKLDLDWRAARRKAGGNLILGGTVNNADDAANAVTSDSLDYVGVGPLRFTTTKQKLAPVLGLAGIKDLIARLDGLPAWVIGGVEAADLPALRDMGASGVAVTGALYRGGRIEANLHALIASWGRGASADTSRSGWDGRAATLSSQ
jgi:thiamine-phosphate pyrophosphorylase